MHHLSCFKFCHTYSLFAANGIACNINNEIISGKKVLNCVLYKPHKYPKGAIGSVEIMFNPSCNDESSAQMWLWCHISLHEKIKEVLSQVFEGGLIRKT